MDRASMAMFLVGVAQAGVPGQEWAQCSYHVALNPALLPTVRVQDGEMYYVEHDAQGHETIGKAVSLSGLVDQLDQELANTNAWVSQIEFETQRGHWVSEQAAIAQAKAAGQDTTLLEQQALQGLKALAEAQDSGLKESVDFKSQSFGALVVHLDSDPNVQAAQTQLTQVFKDVDNDGYYEQTQTVAAHDSAGKLQAVLTLDFNHDGVIDTGDMLSMVTDTSGLQRNNVAWLDANGDGVLDKNDPAFAAIKLWIDVNQDGVQASGEATSLSSQHIASINFKTGTVSLLRSAGAGDEAYSVQGNATETTDTGTVGAANDEFFRSVA